MRYTIPALALVAVLSGCATDPSTARLVLQAQKEAYNRPTISMTCPAGGCSLTYHDPRDTSPFKMPTNGWDAVVSLGNNVTGLAQTMVVPGAIGYVAAKGFSALKGSGAVTTTNTTNTANTATTSTTGPSNSGNTVNTPTTTSNTTTGPSNSGNTTTTPTTTTSTSTTNTNSGNTVPSTTTVTTTGSNNTNPPPAAP